MNWEILLNKVSEISQWRALLIRMSLHIDTVIKVVIRREYETVYYCAERERVSKLKFKQDGLVQFEISLNKKTEVSWGFSNELIYEPSEFKALLKLLSSRCEITNSLSSVSHKAWEKIAATHAQSEVIAVSESMKSVLQRAALVAPFETTVLLQGESGTGKDIIANFIHKYSKRDKSKFLAINCASLPSSLIESTLFGHEKGAFTGALSQKKGYFERASNGTLFLDEVGELGLDVQAKLLRVLENGEFERVGGDETLKSSVRIIAATHKDIKNQVSKDAFRQDLYYRLSTFTLLIPPLRSRKVDIPPLAEHFLSQLKRKLKVEIKGLTAAFNQQLISYDWPGNARELSNELEKAMILSQGKNLKLFLDDEDIEETAAESLSFEDHVKSIIQNTLNLTEGRVHGSGGAAELLQLNPQTLYSKMRKYGIKKN